eukprot:3748332-Amphidinium_carterae.1
MIQIWYTTVTHIIVQSSVSFGSHLRNRPRQAALRHYREATDTCPVSTISARHPGRAAETTIACDAWHNGGLCTCSSTSAGTSVPAPMVRWTGSGSRHSTFAPLRPHYTAATPPPRPIRARAHLPSSGTGETRRCATLTDASRSSTCHGGLLRS